MALPSNRETGQTPRDILTYWQTLLDEDRLAHLIRDTARALTKTLQLRLAEQSIPIGHWTFLRILWRSDGLTQKELSTRAGVKAPTTAVAMQAMEAAGYIFRVQLPTNQKNSYVYLTPQGRQLKEKLVPLAEEVNRISVHNIEREKLEITREVLLTMLANLAAEGPAAVAGE